MRRYWVGLALLSLTCARPAPEKVAHAQSPAPPAMAPPAALPSAQLEPARPLAAQPEAPPSVAVRGPLTTFFEALHALENGSRREHVRVLWLGDSHTNADFLSGTVRATLRERFGDGGPGFVRLGTKPYRHEGVKVGRDGKWNVEPSPPSRRTRQDNGVFGIGGTRATPSAGASWSAQVIAREPAASLPAHFELLYTLPPNASISLELAAKKWQVDEKTPADAAASGISHLSLTAPLGSKWSGAVDRGSPCLFGVIIERADKPGFVLDTSGIDGARLETPLAWDETAFEVEVARRAPELFVLAYGTNEAFDALNVERYGPQLTELVARLRRATPQASCLVLGPTDAPLGEGSVPRVAEVTQVLRASAGAVGCSFVSLQQLMGGEGSFALGMKAKERLARPDKLHLTPKGYQELGLALAQQLLDAYSAGRAELP